MRYINLKIKSLDEYTSTKAWYKDGFLHRDNDKPALILSQGVDCEHKYYKNGVEYKFYMDDDNL